MNFKEMEKKLDEVLENMTDEEIEKYFPKSKTPKGWVSIEDELPQCMAMDFITQGYSEYRVKDKDRNEFITRVTDHMVWYHMIAKQNNITHWFNE